MYELVGILIKLLGLCKYIVMKKNMQINIYFVLHLQRSSQRIIKGYIKRRKTVIGSKLMGFVAISFERTHISSFLFVFI